jgi:Retroviral aspartyl protease
MTICTFLHLRSKRAEAIALLDSGATENFMNLEYAKYLHLPIQRLKEPRKLFNIDGTPNQSRELQYFTDLQVQMGTQHSSLQFFLSNLGENKVILGYPWFAAFQPRIDWKRGWIDHSQLPVILRSSDALHAQFLPRQINKP